MEPSTGHSGEPEQWVGQVISLENLLKASSSTTTSHCHYLRLVLKVSVVICFILSLCFVMSLAWLGSLCALAGSVAALNLTVPDIIKAGQEVTVTVEFDFWKQPYEYEHFGSSLNDPQAVCVNPPPSGCSYDALWRNYQLYLLTPDFMFFCHLTDVIETGKTNPKFTIPKDIGPSLDTYQVIAFEFNGTKVYMTDSGTAESNKFFLTGTTISSTSNWEDKDGWVKPYASIPCSSYGCFRDCGVQYSDKSGFTDRDSVSDMFACFNKCPGIVVDLEDSNWNWLTHGEAVTGSASISVSQAVPTPYIMPTTITGDQSMETEKPSAVDVAGSSTRTVTSTSASTPASQSKATAHRIA
ncbi:hypothetical protein G7046_g4637 [Stylonectria norvegica]|nr:hypothetical protein G7046_g4637 [Stylonectria norvegica]